MTETEVFNAFGSLTLHFNSFYKNHFTYRAELGAYKVKGVLNPKAEEVYYVDAHVGFPIDITEYKERFDFFTITKNYKTVYEWYREDYTKC